MKTRIFIPSLFLMCSLISSNSNTEEKLSTDLFPSVIPPNIHSKSTDDQKFYQPTKDPEEELMMDLFLSVILPNIQTAVSNYYAEFLTNDPLVYPYEIKILNMERLGQGHSFQFVVTVEVMPVVGPHISVGKDLVTLDVSPGNVALKEFKHLETYELPPNWQHIKKT